MRINLLTLAALFASLALAVETRFWQQYDPADLDKATLKNLSMRSDGVLTLAPVFKEIYDTPLPYLWAVADDSKGNVYVGGGAPGATTAKLFQIDSTGKGKVLAELQGFEIHAIAVDRQDNVYAATSPDGKVYKITASGQSSVFYDPKVKYVWAMLFNPSGDLFIATGDKGEIHRVTPNGQGSVFFSTDETHARSLAIDAKNNLIVGTEPGGLVLRVSPSGEGFVLYQSSKREVTAVGVAKDGAVYAAAVGNKTAATAPMPPPPPAPQPAAAPGTVAVTRIQTAPPPTIGAASSVAGGSEVYRIDPDGAPRKAWSHSTELVYAIGFDANGRPLFGTGNRGRIYRLDDQRLHTHLVTSPSTQITALLTSRRGVIYAVSANLGKLFQLGPQIEKEGTFDSDALDAGSFSYWGRARYDGADNGGKVALETRSGNLDRPQKNWSAWAPVVFNSTYGRMTSPAARFLQYRLKLTAAANGASPAVNMVELAYLGKNVAPTVDELESTPANYRFPTSTALSSSSTSITLPALGSRRRSSSGISLDSSSSTMNHAKGHIGARWRASDENSDTLQFKLEIRGIGEKEWKLLKDNLRDRQYSFDSTAFPDGYHQFRVTAIDSPSNPPAQALSAQLESDPFLIDNSAPQITNLAAAPESGKVTVRFKAKDARSVIEKAEYSVNGGEWLIVPPVTRLADSLELDYVLEVPRTGSTELTIAVRVSDEFENQAVDKVTVR